LDIVTKKDVKITIMIFKYFYHSVWVKSKITTMRNTNLLNLYS